MYDGIVTHLVVGFCDQVMRPKHRENELDIESSEH